MIRVAILSQLLGGEPERDPYVEPLVRVRSQLYERGIVLVREAPDLVLVDSAEVEAADLHCPLILFDRTDGSMLWWYGAPNADRARLWLASPSVVGMLKLVRYRRSEWYNRAWAEGAVHLQRIHDAAAGELTPRPLAPTMSLDESAFARIGLGYGFWAFQHCSSLAETEVDLNKPRALDVVCACTTDYNSAAVTHHRRRAVDAVERLADVRKRVERGRLLPLPEYHAQLLSARICVSPWGWGETTIRDYEAMLAGCVLIKPWTEFIESIPAVDERHYVPCAVDFSDLSDRVAAVLADWDAYAEMRRQNRERLLAVRRPAAIAELVAGAIRRFVAAIE